MSLNLARAVVALAIVVLPGACGGGREESPLTSSVGVADLLATPARFDGRVVTVTGVAIIQFEGTSLYPSLALAKKDIGAGVWLDLDYRRYIEFDRKQVRGEGRFLYGPAGHFDLRPGEISPVPEISIVDEGHGGSESNWEAEIERSARVFPRARSQAAPCPSSRGEVR